MLTYFLAALATEVEERFITLRNESSRSQNNSNPPISKEKKVEWKMPEEFKVFQQKRVIEICSRRGYKHPLVTEETQNDEEMLPQGANDTKRTSAKGATELDQMKAQVAQLKNSYQRKTY